MSSNDLISVVLPVYNAEMHLVEAIESILSQTYRNFELIIINDGSTDGSLQILERYQQSDKRIKIISRPNKGLIDSLNEGILESKGQYIARMDADDIALPDRLRIQLEHIKKGYDLVGGHYICIGEDGKYLDVNLVPTDDTMLKVKLCFGPPFPHPGTLFRAELASKILYCRQNYTKCEDYYFWVRFLKLNAKMSNVDDFVIKYRLSSNSLSRVNFKAMRQQTKSLGREVFGLISKDITSDLNNVEISSLNNREKIAFGCFMFRLLASGNLVGFDAFKRLEAKFVVLSFLCFLLGRNF